MSTKRSLLIPYALLLIFSTIQLSLVSQMVTFLHIQKTQVMTYQALNSDSPGFKIHVLPEKLSLNQGHTTNGAAGYGLVLSITFLVITFFLQGNRKNQPILLIMTLLLGLLVLFVLSAFIYVFAVTYMTSENRINTRIAESINGAAYPIDSWTPETWYRALLLLPLTGVDLTGAYQEMVAWRWWTLPYLAVSTLAFGWTAVVCVKDRGRLLNGGYVVYGNGDDSLEEKIAAV
ncbi:hypothetical protein BGW36DRAFT_450608 [Talaromyces proteolyticus]|uniref:Uncharacterized protein n=1 Tax=Talaromyces proteolyticus TaxID=1131652 RepID=A0AAD4KVP2_9EURO|nr:uncharacterized protein BGW36DRAFT_450608 [Talaromyces proteolyticus]KAH8697855.1 hypothetical protein BGW36DRAFT_450608 [Talaromyces proteolyticus]